MKIDSVSKLLRISPRIPLWLLARLLQMHTWPVFKYHDVRTLDGWMWSPCSRKALFFGWCCWLIVLEGVILLVRWLLDSV
jgi:hypothetical protein